MRRRAVLAPPWLHRFPEGEAGLLRLLAAEQLDGALPGRWTRLDKAGLGGRERWRWELPDGAVLYVKRYTRTPLREQWDRIWRQSGLHSRAAWEQRVAQHLAERFVPVVQPAAVAEEMLGLWERRSVVVLEAAAGDAVDRVLPRLLDSAPVRAGSKGLHALTRELGRLASAFHSAGVCHRDFYLCHIFTTLADLRNADDVACTIIDLARAHRPWLRGFRWRIKDLSALDVSARQIGLPRTTRLRFLLAYLGLERGAARARTYAAHVVCKSDGVLSRMERKQARR